MTDAMTDLARRAVACRGWRWMPGMRWWTEDDRGRLDDFQPEYMGRPPDALPDFTDPATLGCLLALVREKHNDQSAHVYWSALFRAWAVSFSCKKNGQLCHRSRRPRRRAGSGTRGCAMTDKNGAPLSVGTRVRFHFSLRGHATWLDGTVRAIKEHTYYHPKVTLTEALVDDGDPANTDMHTNGWTAAAWLSSPSIEVLPFP